MRKIIILLALAGTATMSRAQQVRPANSATIYREIAQLQHLTNVLYVAAHPDDENTRLLAWLVNDQHIRTAYLSLTRGDGGQNILGDEQGAALGLIRTHELLEARKIDGAEQFFSRAVDFGFSKNFTETFKHWNPDTLTHDAVWVMRKFRPDVVICRFPPNAMAGHGQHAASAIVAAKAFKESGNTNNFPQELAYYPAWKPTRLLFNTYHFGKMNTTSEDQFKLTVGQYLPGIGMGTGELAGMSRSVHKSQGAGTPSIPGTQIEYFKLVDGDTLSKSLFDGIDITWNRVGRKDIEKDIQNIIDHYDYRHPDASLPALLAVRQQIETVQDDYWRKEKLAEINKIILHCAGFMAELYTDKQQAVAGASLPFTLHIIARTKTTPVTLTGIDWVDNQENIHQPIGMDSLITYEHKIRIPANTPITQPYWLAQQSSNPNMYVVPNDTLLGLPTTPNNLIAKITLQIGSVTFTVPVPLSYKKLDPVKGDVVEALHIVPDVCINFVSNLVVTQPDGSTEAAVNIQPFKDINDATLTLKSDNDKTITLQHLNLHAMADTIVTIPITIKSFGYHRGADYNITASISANGQTYDKSLHVIEYPHIPTLQYFSQPTVKVLFPSWVCKAKRIGYIEGAGDKIPAFLRLAGLQVDILKESDMTDPAKLKKYDAIMTGIRAVNVEKRMKDWMPVLLQYVADGGTLVMQYNTLQDLSTTKVGPYPITLSTERVTEEDAPVLFTDAKNPILNYPNKITEEDFEGWVQERGLYFATEWDSKYQPLFSMHDTGEQPLKGSTLYTKYGKGNYIYTALSFSRQIPAGNKGAIELLMNMLSVGK